MHCLKATQAASPGRTRFLQKVLGSSHMNEEGFVIVKLPHRNKLQPTLIFWTGDLWEAKRAIWKTNGICLPTTSVVLEIGWSCHYNPKCLLMLWPVSERKFNIITKSNSASTNPEFLVSKQGFRVCSVNFVHVDSELPQRYKHIINRARLLWFTIIHSIRPFTAVTWFLQKQEMAAAWRKTVEVGDITKWENVILLQKEKEKDGCS